MKPGPLGIDSFSNKVFLKNQLTDLTGILGTSSIFVLVTPEFIRREGCFCTISVGKIQYQIVFFVYV